MRKLKFAALIIGITLVILLVIFYVVGYFRPKSAGLIIETQPQAAVLINGQQEGRTNFEITRAQGEVVIKLIPESFDKPLVPFETKVNLVSGVKTVIRRNFGESLETSSGTVISFEKIGGQEVGVSIISTPDASQVKIDGQVRGFTPYKSSAVSPGSHIISLSAQGYKDESIDVRTYEGYKLTAEFKLAPNTEQASPSPTPEPQEEKPQVKILSTPTGFLRVRNEPSALAREVGQVDPGETFEILEEDEETGWYKIEYEKDQEGWVSNQYASKTESSKETSTPSPTPTP
ncbi:hypothetical protein A2W13_01385 [Candidatus Woesebacteria bacterium RBG_16_36_11]|uniref:SH3b domain-containing protein n=3 Tax=Candidatus Woeseibacteriota TaxID=1752722 RepID=A0A1F7XBY8_9BACT|nr:MAG: hypothetical protein A2Z67_03390 [Candidatus Woesebacteria bacterium RBG_13_36_22]OGM12279.1 MAG: hypothetical protein A2W13_01385 [Candidatus Woesebacteria bacterium RBG_16_36_11]OGM16303.1 MAG: hypothetical protein A2V55_01130 [Candidatus Woesebacteria bacterium RBG_19FT_COMBO_37_29]